MPKSKTFTTDSTKTLKEIMNPKTTKNPAETTSETPVETPAERPTTPPQSFPKSLSKKIHSKMLKDNLPPLKAKKSKPPDANRSKEKESMIMKILKYQESKRFGDKLRKGLGLKYTRQQLLKCSNENLEAILYRINSFLNNSNLDAVFEHMARHSAQTYEQLVSKFYDIEGFSSLLLSNSAFWDAFEFYKINQEVPDIPPGFQLLYIIISTTYLAHLQNQYKQKRKPEEIRAKKNQPKEIVITDKDDISVPKPKKSTKKVGQMI